MKKTLCMASLVFSLFTTPLAAWAGSVNINKADVATLDKLEGIGTKKAEAIVAWRTQHGEFKSLEQLKEVPGIGEKLFDKIKSNVALNDGEVAPVAASTPPAVAPASAPATTPSANATAMPTVNAESKPAATDTKAVVTEVKPGTNEAKPNVNVEVKPTASTDNLGNSPAVRMKANGSQS